MNSFHKSIREAIGIGSFLSKVRFEQVMVREALHQLIIP